jgi:hypothetical protein
MALKGSNLPIPGAGRKVWKRRDLSVHPGLVEGRLSNPILPLLGPGANGWLEAWAGIDESESERRVGSAVDLRVN